MRNIVEQLRNADAFAKDGINYAHLCWGAADEIERLELEIAAWKHSNELKVQEIERLREALQKIVQWAEEAYSTNIFHEPTKEQRDRADELLTANGMTLDAFSASMGRHCLKGVGDIAKRTLDRGAT